MMRRGLTATADEIQAMVRVAMEKEHADLVIVGGDLVNVYTGELLRSWPVAVKGSWIACVGEDVGHTIGPDTQVIDATGKVLIPGFIDGHVHALWIHSLQELLKFAISCGTTTIISDTTDFSYTLGYDGVVQFLECARDQPTKVFATLPSIFATAQSDYADIMDPGMFSELLERGDILGLGESSWVPVVNGDRRVIDLFADTSGHRKKLEGHGAGARGRILNSFVAAGVSSCHESTTAAEALEKLRLGMCVMVREGGGRKDLEAVSAIKDENVDFRRLALTTDILSPAELIQYGYMDHVVQKAIDLGFAPITAVQMATLNVAEHFSIDDVVGGIAPGKYADILIMPDLASIRLDWVISNGQVVARDGVRLVDPRPYDYPESSRTTVRLPHRLEAADFRISVDDDSPEILTRIIDLTSNIANKEAFVALPVRDRELKASLDADVLKVAAIDRLHNQGKMFVGLVRGFGLKKGAFASTASWNSSNVLIVGAGEKDMAGAGNRIRDLQGGVVLYADGEVLAELPMPIGGNVSDLPMEAIADRLEQIKRTLADLGCRLPDPHLMLVTLTCTVVPSIRLSTDGLIRVKDGKVMDLMVQNRAGERKQVKGQRVVDRRSHD
ncbi:MAG: adenine deaminase [Chloroflexi bacterium]|nr:adenine deaminase [Chloroflexota bacterium]